MYNLDKMKMQDDPLTTIFKRKLLELHGINPEADPYEVFSSQQTKINNLNEELRLLKSPPVSSKWVVKLFLDNRSVTPQQKKLMKALKSGHPRKEDDLIRLVGIRTSATTRTHSKKVVSLRRLVLRMNKYFQNDAELKQLFAIKPLYGQPFNGYKLEINGHVIGVVIK